VLLDQKSYNPFFEIFFENKGQLAPYAQARRCVLCGSFSAIQIEGIGPERAKQS